MLSLVCQRAVEHVADTISMSRWPWVPKPVPGADAVFVDDPQVAHAHVGRVVVVGKGKAVPAVQPAVLGVAAVCEALRRVIIARVLSGKEEPAL
jgi:hypothetical protein